MGDHATKNESENESEQILNESNLLEGLNAFWVNRNMGDVIAGINGDQIEKMKERHMQISEAIDQRILGLTEENAELRKRILAIEMALMSFSHNLEQGSGHPNDGGWFE